MQVKVHHRDDRADDRFVHVATVETPEIDIGAALEFAWERTQNIEGSWSKGPVFPADQTWSGKLEANPDHHPSVTLADGIVLKVNASGRTLGLRSSMVGDRFEAEGMAYRAAGCGFEPVV